MILRDIIVDKECQKIRNGIYSLYNEGKNIDAETFAKVVCIVAMTLIQYTKDVEDFDIILNDCIETATFIMEA